MIMVNKDYQMENSIITLTDLPVCYDILNAIRNAKLLNRTSTCSTIIRSTLSKMPQIFNLRPENQRWLIRTGNSSSRALRMRGAAPWVATGYSQTV